MDRLIAPQIQRKRKIPNFSKSGMVIPSPGMREKSRKVRKRGSGSRFCLWNEQTRISEVGSAGRPDWQSGLSGLHRLIEVAFMRGKRKLEEQTRLAPDEETTLREAPGGLLMQVWFNSSLPVCSCKVWVRKENQRNRPDWHPMKKRLYERLPVCGSTRVYLYVPAKFGSEKKTRGTDPTGLFGLKRPQKGAPGVVPGWLGFLRLLRDCLKCL
ncbi:hypothetical protein CRG98_010650 [Punica granatum]|uniref:Uncharacterized protein n=1 Tax=Punica granatum TaxID=22663 RepID=A0A2I0KKX4_PUNGR|nr:hypothetical protein CRG98_010650 [Punica granatum]